MRKIAILRQCNKYVTSDPNPLQMEKSAVIMALSKRREGFVSMISAEQLPEPLKYPTRMNSHYFIYLG